MSVANKFFEPVKSVRYLGVIFNTDVS